MASSSLSSVVSDLMRASMGNAVPKCVTDEDLDRHIGEIILREAKQKAERYKKDGIRAYLPAMDANVPRANKRFLSSIIRSTDDHNKAILRSQAIAAAELKEEREEQARRERRARANEAAQDRLRRLMSGGRRDTAEDRWRPDRERDKRRGRSHRDKDEWSREKSRSRSPSRKRYWDEDEEEYQQRTRSSHRHDRRHRRHRCPSLSRSRSPRRNQSKHRSHSRTDVKTSEHRSQSPKRERKRCSSVDTVDDSLTPSRRRHTSLSGSRSPRRDDKAQSTSRIGTPLPGPEPTTIRSPSPTPGPSSRSPSPSPISKMDKYFSPTYDPRLDVAPLLPSSSSRLTIDVPATGLVDNAQFEGWDAMLELIRQRREDRAEKKRLERLGLLPDKTKEGRGKKGKGMVSATADEGKGIMEIEYAKKGAMREWDMGKEVI